MIKAILLILTPIGTWERIVAARRRWVTILALYLLPTLLLVSLAEGYGLVNWGKPRGRLGHIHTFTLNEVLIFEGGVFALYLLVVFISAWLIKSLGDTFHGRHTFTQAFTVAAYGLAPMFLIRLLDAYPHVPPWLTWPVGMVLSMIILYHGLPRVMLPDPPHALGLYFSTIFLLVIITGLVRFVTAWYLMGRFTKLDDFISRFTQ